MVTINYKGRTANHFIQHIVGHFLARKYNLKLTQESPINNPTIKFNDINNSQIGRNRIIVDDTNWLDIVFNNFKYDSPSFYLDGFFNNRKFFEFFEEDIKKHMIIQYDHSINQNDVIVHYRIGDLTQIPRCILPLEYYCEALESIQFNQGYITSDTLEHELCQKLIKKYNLIPLALSPSDTIAYCKNFNKIILSEGGFSWSIGFLSKAKEIICNQRELIWHGDIFFEKWKKLRWDYSPDAIYDKVQLKEYKPIKLND